MANIKDRPYVGTWSLDGRKLVQHTPDALVYLNGSVTLPRCRSCDGRINIQKFITEVSVEAGTDPNGASASFTLSVPLHSSDSFARDAKFLLRPGLEVHIYERGFFPVKGLYSNLAEPTSQGNIQSAESFEDDHDDHDGHDHGPPIAPASDEKQVGFRKRKRKGAPDIIVIHESGLNNLNTTEKVLIDKGYGVHYIVMPGKTYKYGDDQKDVFAHAGDFNGRSIGIEFNHAYSPGKGGHKGSEGVIKAPWYTGGRYVLPKQGHLEQLWKSVVQIASQNNLPIKFGNVQGDKFKFGTGFKPGGSIYTHSQLSGSRTDGEFQQLYMALRDRGYSPSEAYQEAVKIATTAKKNEAVTLPPAKGAASNPGDPGAFEVRTPEGSGPKSKVTDPKGFTTPADYVSRDIDIPLESDTLTRLEAEVGPSILERFGLEGSGIEDISSYPYYHTFHGVVIQVAHSWSGGFQTITVQCASMLHFWQYHKISAQMGLVASHAANSGNNRNLKGHNFTNWHPYQIIYHLHLLTFGAQDASGGALTAADNRAAVSDLIDGAGEKRQLWSLTMDYWNRRFQSGRMANLRMHGFSGELYSSLQAAYLGQDSSERLKRRIRNRFAPKKPPAGKIDALTGLNLNNDRKLRGLLFSRSSLSGSVPASRSADHPARGNPDTPNLNMAMVQPFAWSMANTANWGLFESTYMSKLDVAQRVMEVTGYEFYQDVNGDLVFKPPMWNLDTSGSRVYRIEDIDIINISFDEKEPQATYAVVKSNQFTSGGTDVGIGGDYGQQAVYMDHRAIAQFGFRPFEFETMYLDDPRSMYYMGVARLDFLNIGTHSASLTIPLRPEIRPGYPVYIPYLDCYYYIRTLSHSYSVGGQCTTTLQLVGKRSKFYAPGVTDQTGIDAIDLSDGTLPPRPLEVQGPDGTPRLSGFPNVVLALDPEGVNPMWYPTGASITRLETDQDFKDFLRMAGREGLGILAKNDDGTYSFDVPVGYSEDGSKTYTTRKIFYFGPNVTSKAGGKKKGAGAAKKIPEGAIDFKQAVKAYQGFKLKAETINSTLAQAGLGSTEEAKLKELAKAIKDAGDRRQALNEKRAKVGLSPSETAELTKLEQEDQKLKQQHRLWQEARGNPTLIAILSSDASEGVKLIYQLMDLFAQRFWVAGDPKSFEDITTHHLAQLLWNKKSNFAPEAPGTYRYYSASHPDPDDQGQPLITFRTPDKGGVDLQKTPQALNDEWADITVKGYIRTPDAAPGTYLPEAKLEDVKPLRGILVASDEPGIGTVLPTSEIRTVMFSTQLVDAPKKDTKYTDTRAAGTIAQMAMQGLLPRFTVKSTGKKPEDTDSIKDIFEPTWNEFWAAVIKGVIQAMKRFEAYDTEKKYELKPPPFFTAFPTALEFLGTVVATDKSADTFEFSDNINPDPVKLRGLKKKESFTLTNFFDEAGKALAERVRRSLGGGFRRWMDQVVIQMQPLIGTMTQEGADLALTTMVDHIVSVLKVPISFANGSREVMKGRRRSKIWSPVFPVSDENGYEHVGAFQYGRGLDIEPGGVLDLLGVQDPLSVLDRKTINDLISALIRNEPVTVEVEKELPGGKKVKVKETLQGNSARGALERKALIQLRKSYSDQQLLDLGLLVKSGKDPNLLEFNLMNWIATQKEGVHKLPVVNAAFSLADLTFQQDGKVCDCKAAEANHHIEAYGSEGFLQFTPGGVPSPDGYGTGDRASQWIIQQALQASAPHKMQQDAMRGVALDKPKFGSFDEWTSSFTDPAERVERAALEAKERFDRSLEAAKAKADEAFTNVEDAFTPDEE